RELVARVNHIRRRHAALQRDDTLRFHATDNPSLIAYTKTASPGPDVVLTIVNLSPRRVEHGVVDVGRDVLDQMGVGGAEPYTARDLIDDASYRWHGARN